jgi:hypothetical protein
VQEQVHLKIALPHSVCWHILAHVLHHRNTLLDILSSLHPKTFGSGVKYLNSVCHSSRQLLL